MKIFKALFFNNKTESQIIEIAASSKTQAIRSAKIMAKQMDLRFLELIN